ncbi:MAG: (2Fe-2S)-binding protein [bacterium]|nr:(2Fe-2S)-binding protein [bacterium]
MPRVHLPQKKRSIEIDSGTTLFQALRANDIPIASSCQGDAVCGRCAIEIVNGIENVSPIEPDEVRMAERLKWRIDDPKCRIRAACQVRVLQNEITVRTTYW